MAEPRQPRSGGPLGRVEAVAAERERIARLLHDDPLQAVSVATLHVELLAARIGTELEEVTELREALRHAATQMRALMDLLRRPTIGTSGLAISLRSRIAPAGATGATVVDDLLRDPPEPVAYVLHWIAEETVRALRASRGYSGVTVTLQSPQGGYTVEVLAASAPSDGHSLVALDGVRRIASLLGPSSVDLDDSAPGRTRIRIHVPWPE
ncbi:MAG: histidine kinase [Patulibacter minatonensis]